MGNDDLEEHFYANRRIGRKGLIVFLNAGDPCVEVTLDLLHVLERCNVDAVELCVPFANSVTDGAVIRRSHERALAAGVGWSEVLALVRRARSEVAVPIILLADYSYTVRPVGLETFLRACRAVCAQATLIHGLPPRLRYRYLERSEELGLDRILSFFVESSHEVREAAYQAARGFVYVASHYGRTGARITFDNRLIARLNQIRGETLKPLAVGFGVRTAENLQVLYQAGIDAAVIGSVVAEAMETALEARVSIPEHVENLLKTLRRPAGATLTPEGEGA